ADPLLAARAQLSSLFDSVGPREPQRDLFAPPAVPEQVDGAARLHDIGCHTGAREELCVTDVSVPIAEHADALPPGRSDGE
ncbi:MAG: hypothetical protein ACREPE_01710, partial [Lysobacter sp.]